MKLFRVKAFFCVLAGLTIFAPSPAFGQIPQLNSPLNIRETLPMFIHNVAEALDRQLTDKIKFLEELFAFKQDTDAKVVGILDRLTGIIKNYADNNGTFEESSDQLVNDLQNFSAQLNRVPEEFPRANEVLGIVGPYVEHLVKSIQDQFPTLAPIPRDGNPLGNFYDFFRSTEQRNSFGMGAFFRLVFLNSEKQKRNEKSLKLSTTQNGIKKEKTIFQEVTVVKNNELVFHEIIQNDATVVRVSKRDDFSTLHGLPEAMRREGVNERFVVLVDEYLKLVNYHLLKNFNERGLIIPADHPQLVFPPGYSPDHFVANFTNLLLNILKPGVAAN